MDSPQDPREQRRLIVIPNLPLPVNRLEAAVPHGFSQDLIDSLAKRGVSRRENAHIVRYRHRLRVRDKSRRRPAPALGQHVVQQHGVEPSDQQI